MRWTADGTHQATCIFEAACFHQAIKPVCRCGHASTFNPHGLWWLFQQRHWDDRFAEARLHFWCRVCGIRTRRKIMSVRIETAKPSAVDVILPWPDEREWKRAVRRFRA
ncbi:hypothetical protein [Novosphingobium percolationis]|uniref:hypothetical protein n=1 Tax=Novosphingobium percolationis TaxID=2871811 RepID=UPI00296F69A6|nr:hypothetical protein [Novosphingobium percolationis]